MNAPCPHCPVEIDIDPETLAALQGQAHFQCPSCGGLVPVPAVTRAPVKVTASAVVRPSPSLATSRSSIPSLASAHRGLNRNFLILGAVALLVLGGIGFFLASQKSGDTNTVNQNIRNEIINNSYFTQLITDGITTKTDLEAIADIRPYGDGFIGISKEALTWEQANDMAKRTGSVILNVAPDASESSRKLIDWLSATFSSRQPANFWICLSGEARVFDGHEILPISNRNESRKALFEWSPPEDGGVKSDIFSPLVNGLSEVGAAYQQGGLMSTDPAWRGIVGGRDAAEGPNAIVLARQFGQGRLVAVTENAFWGIGVSDQNITLGTNILRWLSEHRNREIAFLRGGQGFENLVPHHKELGFAAPDTILPGFNVAQLAAYGVVIAPAHWDADSVTAEETAAIVEYVRGGGSLLMTGLAWSYPKPLATFPPNMLGSEFGVIWLPLGVRDSARNFGNALQPRYTTFYPGVKLSGLDEVFDVIRQSQGGASHSNHLFPRARRILEEATAALKAPHPVLDRIAAFNASLSIAPAGQQPNGTGVAINQDPDRARILAHITRLGGTYEEDTASVENPKPVVKVRLTGKDVDNSTVQGLRFLPGLKSLNLNSCDHVGDAGLAGIANMKMLESLDLGHCFGMTDEGFKHLAGLTNLRALKLQESGSYTYTGSGLVHLKHLTRLEEIDLAYSLRLEDDNLVHLSSLTGLRDLNLMRCEKLTDSGLGHLVSLASLEKLNLAGTKVTDAGIQKLEALRKLKEITLGGKGSELQTMVTDIGSSRLQKAIPGLKVIME